MGKRADGFRRKPRFGRVFGTGFLIAGLATGAALAQEEPAADTDDSPRPFTFSLGLVGEYDDNVRLSSGVTIDDEGNPNPLEAVEEDWVWRVQPALGLELDWEDHVFALDAGADFREGIDTDLSEYNANGNLLLDLNFTGGFGLELWDDYAKTNFDQALFSDPSATVDAGVSESETNALGTTLSYVPVERLEIEGTYERRWEDYVFNSECSPLSDPPCDPATAGDERDVERVAGRVAVPVAKVLRAYGRYRNVEQDSETSLERTYDDEQWAGGLEVEGPAGTRFWLEAGRGSVDFADTAEVDFEDTTIGELGFEMGIGEDSLLRAAVGRDSYDETVWEALLDHTVEEAWSLQVVGQKSTQPSFSSATVGKVFQGTLGSVRWTRFLATKLELALEGSYFRLVSENETGASQTDETWLGRVELFYSPREWVRIGPHYQYSERDSTIEDNRFDDMRAGLSAVFTY